MKVKYLILLFSFLLCQSSFNAIGHYSSSSYTECSECDGHGEFICKKCKGKGYKMKEEQREECKKCKGLGKIICKDCHGYGGYYVQYCLECDKRGFDERGKVLCPYCHGTGIQGSRRIVVRCSKCNGSQEEKCPTCHGNPKGPLKCTTCNDTGHIKCSKCRDGKVVKHQNMVCVYCNGKKSITCPVCCGFWKITRYLDE